MNKADPNSLQRKPYLLYDRLMSVQKSSQVVSTLCNCDCACPDPVQAYVRRDRINSVEYQVHPELERFELDNKYYALLQPLSFGPVVVNDSALELLDSFKRPKLITPVINDIYSSEEMLGIIDEYVALGFLVPVVYKSIPGDENASSLAAWLHITNACNLRCSYCYLDKSPQSMSIETGYRAISAVFRSAQKHQYARIQLKYAGGEPTLAMATIFKLHRHAEVLSDGTGIALDSVILSNGTVLSRSTMKEIRAAGLRLMISMDGLDAGHDSQRPYRGGKASSGSVKRAIDELLDIGLIPHISITITDRNLKMLPSFIEWLLIRNLPFSLNHYRESAKSQVNPDLTLQNEEVTSTMREVLRIIESNLPPYSVLSALVDLANLGAPHTRACGVGRRYMVIDPEGNIAKCQMAIKHPTTTIYDEDPLGTIRHSQEGPRSLPVMLKEGCNTCQWRFWCAGGCPLETHRVTGRLDVPSPKCDVYKALYPAIVRLEALRLLKSRN